MFQHDAKKTRIIKEGDDDDEDAVVVDVVVSNTTAIRKAILVALAAIVAVLLVVLCDSSNILRDEEVLVVTVDDGGANNNNNNVVFVVLDDDDDSNNNTSPPVMIPSNYVGFSYEYGGARELTNSSSRSPIYARLLQNLMLAKNDANTINKTFTIRIGGNSADGSCYYYPPQHPLPSPLCNHRITDDEMTSWIEFAKIMERDYDVTIQYVVDTNMGVSSNPDDVFIPHIERLDELDVWKFVSSIEIGNEVDLYKRKGVFRNLSSYDYADYEREYDAYITAYLNTTSTRRASVQGGTWCTSDYLKNLEHYIVKFDRVLASFSFHKYALNGNDIVNSSTIDEYLKLLLGDRGVESMVRHLKPLVDVVASRQLPFVLGETNSASHGGVSGVSDTFASALWVVDYLSALSMKAGVSQVLLHLAGPSPKIVYTAFAYDYEAERLQVRPIYYGILLFNELVGADETRWIGTTVSTAAYPTKHIFMQQSIQSAIHSIILS